MPTSAFTRVQSLNLELGKGTHNFTAHTLKAALTNTAPTAAGTTKLADITEISATGGYAAGGVTLDSVTWTNSSGNCTLTIADETITAAGGSIGPFRYALIYNNSATNKEAIGFVDYGSAITLADGESLLLNFDDVNGIFKLNY
jgi:hypothetical protein